MTEPIPCGLVNPSGRGCSVCGRELALKNKTGLCPQHWAHRYRDQFPSKLTEPQLRGLHGHWKAMRERRAKP